MKKAIIIGASSGMGRELAKMLIEDGWKTGIAARREDRLMEIKERNPENVTVKAIDVTDDDAPRKLIELIDENGGMDLYIHASGIGRQNYSLDPKIEMDTVMTNGKGFTQMIDAAYAYFAGKGGGHIAAISSIAGTKGLGAAPSYSATKAFQNTYLQALEQLAEMQKNNITFTDIRPGFVKTDLLNDGKNYPMLLGKEYAARKIMNAIMARKHVKVIDWRYELLTGLWKMIPNWLWRKLPVRN